MSEPTLAVRDLEFLKKLTTEQLAINTVHPLQAIIDKISPDASVLLIKQNSDGTVEPILMNMDVNQMTFMLVSSIAMLFNQRKS